MITSKTISFRLTEYKSVEELKQDDRELVNAAKDAARNAYAPYSKFKVGAVENAAFPSGICAERSALSNSTSNYPDSKPVTIAITAYTEDGITREPVSPCGNCRQVIAEEEFRNKISIRVILCGENKIQIIEKGGDLLPLQFSRNYLKLKSL